MIIIINKKIRIKIEININKINILILMVMELRDRISRIPEVLEWHIFKYTRHPLVDLILSDKEYYFKCREKQDFYEYMVRICNFFKEEELWEDTNNYFNMRMIGIIRNIYKKDMKPHRIRTIDSKRRVKKCAIKLEGIYRDHYNVSISMNEALNTKIKQVMHH